MIEQNGWWNAKQQDTKTKNVMGYIKIKNNSRMPENK